MPAVEASTYTADAQPPSWEPATTLPAPTFTTGLDLQSNSGFRVYGIVFEHFSDAGLSSVATISTDSADVPAGTTQLRVEGCAFNYTGPTGVDIERWGDIAGTDGNNRITGNTFVGQTSQALILQTTPSEVACNTVDDIGLLEQYTATCTPPRRWCPRPDEAHSPARHSLSAALHLRVADDLPPCPVGERFGNPPRVSMST